MAKKASEPDYSKYCNICDAERTDANPCPICGIVYCDEHIDPSKHNCRKKAPVRSTINQKRMRFYVVPGTMEYTPRK